MSLRQQLQGYIVQLEKRLRWSMLLRGAAILTAAALLATLILVTIANARAFSDGSVTATRIALISILLIVAAGGLAWPLIRLTRRRAVGKAECAFPQFEQRLTTFIERDGRDPFIELLAEDTLTLARTADPQQFVSNARLVSSLAISAGASAVLIWLIVLGPGFLGYGASLLWTGPHRDKPALYELRVIPGDVVVRRQADQLIAALPTGMQSPTVKLYARYQSSQKWQEIAMQPAAAGNFAGGYQYLLASLPENVEYYITADALSSKHYNLRVTDLPSVKRIKVTYHYPAWTGIPNDSEERAGDLRAVVGTEAELEITTDRPLNDGQIQLDSGHKVQLTGGANHVYHGTLKMQEDGVYHVAGVEQGQPVRVSEDFFIEARKPNPPQIALVRPGRGDYHATPIEEVTIAAKASGDYALKGVELHYSVNGGPDVTVEVLKNKGAKQADGSTTLSLEQFKLEPGDVVSVYAMAKDANAETHTDMTFIQAEPFDREFSQSQQSGGGGGGGGGGDPSAQISQRQKEIISATFKQQNDKKSTTQQAAEISKLLAQSQATLRDQAMTLSGRLQARELTNEVQAISDFQKDMIAASKAMSPAAQSLQAQKWRDAIPNEQKALQYLTRAEATFRQIQVAFGRGGGGGGGGGGGAARDLAALFDLELDTEKNQYETGQQARSQTAEQREKEIEDALKKLDELAKREQNLSQQQQRSATQTAEQKWQQEMLQREAQQLQQQMERQLGEQGQSSSRSSSQSANGRSGQPSGQSSGQSSGQASSQASGQSGRGELPLPTPPSRKDSSASARSSNSPSGSQDDGVRQSQANDARQQAAQRALDRLKQSIDDMKRAGSQNASPADARRAADRLREATDLLGGVEQQDASGKLGSMAQTAGQLTERQKQQADKVRQLIAQLNAVRTSGQQPKPITAQELDKMVSDRQQVADDLSRLTQQIRGAARELAGTQAAASSKLRGALSGMDENDLSNRLQRSSDWLRSGQFSDQAETGLTNDLQKLNQQLAEAARGLGNGQRASKDADINRAMDDLSRLRDRLAGLGRNSTGQPDQAQRGQSQGQGQGQGGQPGQTRQGQAGQGQNGQGNGMGDRAAGPVGNAAGGGNRQGQGYGAWNAGDTRITGQAVAPQPGPNPADTQRDIDQGLNLLNQLRSTVQENPEARQQLQQLIDQMRNLDPKRFPGNPALVEQMHQQLVSGVDALELQLRHQLEESRGGTIRNADPTKIPAGYQNSVADYYRKLSISANH